MRIYEERIFPGGRGNDLQRRGSTYRRAERQRHGTDERRTLPGRRAGGNRHDHNNAGAFEEDNVKDITALALCQTIGR